MKKNVMMRLSALLLVAVLLTTCVISGTFAKYTTAATTTDVAKVAKWGIVVNAVAADNKEYHVTGNVLATEQDDAVFLTSDAQLLAPGAGLELGYLTINGTAEVAVEVVYTASLDLGDAWVVDGDEYCPLVFKVNGTEIKMGGAIDTVEKLENAVVAAIEEADNNLKVAPNQAVNAPALDVECYWEFYVDAETDAKDTALGKANVAGFTLNITCTVNQLDEYTPAQ